MERNSKTATEEHMRNLLTIVTTTFLILGLPLAALADFSGSKTLSANTAISLDTGATAASGGDLLWSGTVMTPQSNAAAYKPPFAIPFSAATQTVVQGLSSQITSKSAFSLAANDVFFVKTNGGNYAAVLVTGISGTSITLQFTTFGVSSSGGSSGPVITQVLNNYGLVPSGFPNSGIAQGSLFILKGSGLADPSAQALPLQDSTAASGLPTTLNGASVKVTVNGTTVTPVFYYAIAAQLALVLPSNTPVGTGTVTATYNSQNSSAAPITVVAAAMGFDSYYGAGSGLGVATNNATGFLYNYANSIPPGTVIALWGSGLGADSPRDSKFSTASPLSINSLAHVYIGGVDAPIAYQGASGYPGLNQVVVTVPNSAPTGCNVSLVGVTASGMPTNFLTLPIGGGTCSDTAFGTTGSQYQDLSGKTTVKSGSVFVAHMTSPNSSGSGTTVSDLSMASFQSVSGSSYGSASGSVSIPGCIVNQTASGGSNTTSTGLDAGTITLTGPSGSPVTMSPIALVKGTYMAQLPSGYIPSSGGTFQFHGGGGADVGSFDTSVVYPNPLMTWTNQSSAATVSRSAGIPITWNGGSSGTFVMISGSSSATVSGQSVSGSFVCIVPQSLGQFTVPSYVTAALPAGDGSLLVANYTNYQSFAATNLDYGIAMGYVAYDIDSKFN
jgi:uncharacterized protein (TIGR03437 family)